MLQIKALNQYYGGSHTLRGIDLDAPRGACTAILGRNGVGKTTLLKCMMGLLPVTSGTVAIEGTDVTKMPPHARARLGVGYVPQGREIFPRLTVAENLAVGAEAAGGASQQTRSEVEALFPILASMRDRRGGDLSGGQQQQLAIGRALMSRPKLLLLDEPTEGIQPSTIKEIERALRELLARGITLVLVEQYVDFALALAQHYAILSRGQIVERGPISELQVAASQKHLAV